MLTYGLFGTLPIRCRVAHRRVRTRAESYVLAVAAVNERAIAVYRRAGFAGIERYQHRTNGGEHEFVRMTRGRRHHARLARRLKDHPECSGAFHGGTFQRHAPRYWEPAATLPQASAGWPARTRGAGTP